MSYLLIVESPSKIKKIESYLGPSYKVIASCGHICTIKSLKDIKIQSNYEPTYSTIDSKNDHIQKMKKEIQKYAKSNIILATDNDREGEAIAYHICRIFGLPVETTTRIIFNEITKDAILDALQPRNHRHINMDLVKSQQARQILDIIIGFKISPMLWKYIYHSKDNALSAGRCQTPALCLIHENEKEIQSKSINRCYKTSGTFFPFPYSIKADLNQEFTDSSEVQDFLVNSQTFSHTFDLGEKTKSTKRPPTPFNTSSLLQTASSILHYSPQVTTSLLQQLYQEGYITYIRTEAKVYAEDFLIKARAHIDKNWGAKFVGDLEKISNQNVKLPHEAIRVTNLLVSSIEKVKDTRMATLYKLIWKHTIQSCMQSAVYENTKVTISAPKNYYYTSIIEIPVFLGWHILEKTDIETGPKQLNYLTYLANNNAPFQIIESTLVERNRLPRYTESSLIKKLEDLGIGRPSTYATFVNTILDKGYVKCQDVEGQKEECLEFVLRSNGLGVEVKKEIKMFGSEKKKLVIQPSGTLCIEFLLKYYSTLFNYSYTSEMEDELDKIMNASNDWYNTCDKTYNQIQELSKNIAKSEKKTAVALDDLHEVVFQAFGPSIRKRIEHVDADDTYEYLPIKKTIKLDMEKLRKGLYKLEDLVEYSTSFLGMYEDQALHRKVGRYGPYLEWGENRKTLRDIEGGIDNLTLEKAIAYLQSEGENKSQISQKTILRVIDVNTTIRRGQYGPYIFYKTESMKKPTFYSLKDFQEDPLTCSLDHIQTFMVEQSQKTKKPSCYKKRGYNKK